MDPRELSGKSDWMMFVDGENFTIRAEKLALSKAWELNAGDFYDRETFIWFPGQHARNKIDNTYPYVSSHAVRSNYYTSVVGDTDRLTSVRNCLRRIGFDPQVFKKERKDQKAKGVDIALTKDMLVHAISGHYSTAVLVAGDGDYVPLVQEVKRHGKRVWLWFFQDCGLSPELRLVADDFLDLTDYFVSTWQGRKTWLPTQVSGMPRDGG